MISSVERILPLQQTVTPQEQSAAVEAVQNAFDTATPVYPIGGGTRLNYGSSPKRPGLGLSLAALDRVVDYPTRDLTITVEAGITIRRLAEQLAVEGQRLPVDVPQAAGATLGGVVATSPSGPRRFRWGTMRDYVIGIRAIDGRGVAFSGGGRVVKNAAGYDLCRLLTGSMGTLGVITQVTLMVKPAPETSAFLACDVADFNTAERLLADLIRTTTLPAAVELLVGPAWKNEPALGGADGAAAARLAVGYEGTEEEVRWMLQQLREEWDRSGVPVSRVIEGPDCDRLWSVLTEFPSVSADENGREPLVLQAGVLPSAVVDTVQQLLEIDRDCSIQAHAGNGVLRARISRGWGEIEAVLQGGLRSKIAAAGGSLVVLSCPGDWRLDREAIWGPPASGADVMRAIKDRFDPKGILNPGRFLF